MLQVLACFQKWKKNLETLPPSIRIASNSRYKTLNYAIIKYLIDHFLCWNNQGIMGEAKCLKKLNNHCWKSTENCQKLQFFFICPSLKPHKIQMKKDNSKFQKHGTWFITWLHFLFFNLSSKPHGCPLKEADLETVKVVNFATKWLNLYPHTVVHWRFWKKTRPMSQALW